MTDVPLHPVLVHVPIALAVLMPLIAGGLLLAWWRGWLRRRGWWLAVAAQAVLFLSGLVAQQTGESDEERVEQVVPEQAIERHEEAADLFVLGGGIVLAFAVLTLFLRNDRTARFLALGTTVGTVVVLGLGYRVGEAGGELVYRHGAASAWVSDAGGGTAVPAYPDEHEDDDDR